MFDYDVKADTLRQTARYNAPNFGDLEWKMAVQLPLSHTDAHITFKEALISNLALERITRSTEAFYKRVVILGDNLAVVSAFTKGRPSSGALKAPCQRTVAYKLSADLHLYHCWIPTGINPVDAPLESMRSERNGLAPVLTRTAAAEQ